MQKTGIQMEEMKRIIECKREIQKKLLCLIEEDGNDEENYRDFFNFFKDQKYYSKHKDIYFLISKIANNHQRTHDFNQKIEQILFEIKDEIKQICSNLEIFQIFQKNKILLPFLIKNNIITIDKAIYNKISKMNKEYNYLEFLYPEIKNFFPKRMNKQIEERIFLETNIKIDEDENYEIFDEIRKKGENHNYLCELIRNDSVAEFIAYINQSNIPLNSKIKPSIFETNLFLMKKKSTELIEYATFCGSIQIFQYLRINDVKLTPSLWLYSIHGQNAEIIHLLEENSGLLKNFYSKCLDESLKCHHFNITDYIINNAGIEVDISKCTKYMNFSYFPDDIYKEEAFYYLCKYDNYDIIKPIFSTFLSEIEIKAQNPLEISIEQNNRDIIGLFLENLNLARESSGQSLFSGCALNEISIPSSVTSIGDKVFSLCTKLKSISIPLSVTTIGNYAFEYCNSIDQLTIPSSVIAIGDHAFECCFSLDQLTIPSSVTKIGDNAFHQCTKLTEITLPSSVIHIGARIFYECSCLTKVTISSSVKIIPESSFSGCSALQQVTIPSSVNVIGDDAFFECSSLSQVTFVLPSSLKSIGSYAFSRCVSLLQINIPSSVSLINRSAFCGCSTLKQLTISSLAITIDEFAFSMCSSLSHIQFVESTSRNDSFIGKSVFYGCDSLSRIKIPAFVTSIGEDVFKYCVSLIEITIPSHLKDFKNYGIVDQCKIITY